jgi:glycosyltransferase involved in cell wall biosynthesis
MVEGKLKVPKITVGMPAFNRAHVLKDTIDQVLNQTFTDFEFIIYNDGSVDDTSNVIRQFSDPRIIFLDHLNAGPPHPLNGILKEARGELIIILHDHDFFHPQLLEKSLEALEKFPNAGFVLQGSAWISEDGVNGYREMLLDLPEFNPGREKGMQLLNDPDGFSSIFHACCMVRRTDHQIAGWFYDNSFGLYADVDLWLRLLQKSDFIYLKEVLFKFRAREENGHFLNDKEFEILEWTYQIHVANIKRYYPDVSSANTVLQVAGKKRNRIIRLHVVRYAALNNKVRFLQGLCLIRDSNMNIIIRLAAKVLLKTTLLQSAIISVLSTAYKLRKW